MLAGFLSFNFIKNNLRAKIILGVILPLIVILAIFAAIENNRQQEVTLSHLTSSSSRSIRVIENSLRHAMLKSDFSEVQSVLDTINTPEDFQVVFLMDTRGEIIFAPNKVGVGNKLDNTQPDCIPCHRLVPDDRPGSMIVTANDGQQVFRSMYPIRNSTECSGCHDPDQKTIGLIMTDIPVAPVKQALEAGFRKNLYWWAGMILLTALIINFSIDSLVLKRLKKLTRSLQGFGKGRHDIRFETKTFDEIGQLGESFNTMGQQIEFDENEKQKLSNQIHNQNIQRGELLKHLITAQEDERKRVARELHDDLGQSLIALSFQVQSLERLFMSNPNKAMEQVNEINLLISETIERMYELILALRPSVLDEFGLVAAIGNHAKKYLDGSGINFTLDASNFSARLSPEVETALYRVFQEAIANVRRHAQAKNVKIRLEIKDGLFRGEIVDDGKGFDLQEIEYNGNEPRGLGMMSIKERIAQYCGEVEILSQLGKGTTVRVQLTAAEVSGD